MSHSGSCWQLFHYALVRAFVLLFFFQHPQACGKFDSWKRVADPTTGKWKKFGFCEFHSAEGALRAFRLLNDFQLGPTKLLVCDWIFVGRSPPIHVMFCVM